MSSITRTRTIIENIADKTFTNEEILNIVEDYIEYNPAWNYTNTEKADKFISLMRKDAKLRIRRGKESEELRNAQINIESALSVLDPEAP